MEVILVGIYFFIYYLRTACTPKCRTYEQVQRNAFLSSSFNSAFFSFLKNKCRVRDMLLKTIILMGENIGALVRRSRESYIFFAAIYCKSHQRSTFIIHVGTNCVIQGMFTLLGSGKCKNLCSCSELQVKKALNSGLLAESVNLASPKDLL